MRWQLQDWIPQGVAAVRCECEAMPDGVRIDMSIFQEGDRSSKRLRRDSLDGGPSLEEERSTDEGTPNSSSNRLDIFRFENHRATG
jgi:hypothetical protein